MNKVLRKRLGRELRSNSGRYLALVMLIIMGVFLVVSMVGSADSIIDGTDLKAKESNVQDGQFSVFVPLDDAELEILSEGGNIIEPEFYIDMPTEDGKVLRLFKDREKTDLVNIAEGRKVNSRGETVIERRFAEVNGYKVGDSITAGGVTLEIVGIGSVPEYRRVTDLNGFKAAYEELSLSYENVCFKKIIDEGGMSFKLIDNTRKGYGALFSPSRVRVTYDDAVEALSEAEIFPELIVMPYLSGHEISVDSLMTEDGVIMLPRFKTWTRSEIVRFDPYIISVCEKFFEKYGLECPCNIQFKLLGDTPYFLEVNTRMSGGVQKGVLATGVNLPNIAVNKLLGIRKPWKIDKSEKKVSFIETPVIV